MPLSLAFWLGVHQIFTMCFNGFIPDFSHYTILSNDGSDTSSLSLRMDFLLDSYQVWLLVVLPFNPALACWLLYNQTRGYAFTYALEGWDLTHGVSPINVISCL